MARDISPEEKLLRLIRSKAPKAAPVQAPQSVVREEEPSGPSTVSRAAAVVNVKAEQPRKSFNIEPSKFLRFENLNIVLTILLVGLLAYFIPLLIKKPEVAVNSPEGNIRSQEKSSPKTADVKNPPLTYFAQPVESKNIFAPVARDEIPSQSSAEQGPKLEDIKSQLNLLGIVEGDAPQAIIEDKKSQKSYFLNKGSTFDDIEVKDILGNKVILKYKGQEFELVL